VFYASDDVMQCGTVLRCTTDNEHDNNVARAPSGISGTPLASLSGCLVWRGQVAVDYTLRKRGRRTIETFNDLTSYLTMEYIYKGRASTDVNKRHGISAASAKVEAPKLHYAVKRPHNTVLT